MTILPNVEAMLGIAAVERDTGLAKDTLRVWERRYGFPTPARDANGERVYSAEQVDKLRLIRRLLDQGKRPSHVVGASTETLIGMLEACRPAPPAATVQEQALLQYVRLHRSAELATALHQLLLKQGLQRFVADTVAPLNDAVGEAWLRGEIDVADEHLYTEQVQNVLRGAIGAHMASAGRPRILLTTLPDELHALGLLMVEATLVPEGIACVSLGTQTPLADIPAAAVAGGFDIVGLSFSVAYPARQAVDALRELRAALPDNIALWAGGGALRDKRRRVPGVEAMATLDEALVAVQGWRAAHTSG
ncbi:MerR family transcriptional regulator [Azoarcus sp. DD4]|uniref:MerR family transcriptional regulator n=1 Tax=Azoarcus sp. DD4 TaxID=2027405 RepID=UPI00112A20BF|nr:MerR family transcriptional regulator [Azoarcus sp. DD4]QDF98699.1 MerR family transcriptional regulator [Azoarcus sp. DD4]